MAVSNDEMEQRSIIIRAAANGDKDALSWLKGEGYISIFHNDDETLFYSNYMRYGEEKRVSQRTNEWRKAVFERDNFICQECKSGNRGIQAHHIKPWSQFKELRFAVSNGITLCPICHAKRHPKHEAFILKSNSTEVKKAYGRYKRSKREGKTA